jgi:PAS domain S-box-containing protein
VQNSPDIIYSLDDKGNFTVVSDAAESLLGLKPEQILGKHYSTIVHEEDMEKARWLFYEKPREDRTTAENELRLKVSGNGNQHCEAGYLPFELKATDIFDKLDPEGYSNYMGTHGVARDITQRKQLEARLHQSQRMEALGTLAGGVAHDFNNLLMGIQGRASLLLLNTDSSDPNHEHLKGIEEYVQSAAQLSGQLLGFAKGGKYEGTFCDLNEILKRTSEMFGRTKKEITIHRKLQKNLWTVEIDKGQIEQVLLNLYVNAWQSMPAGGEFYFQSENVTLGANQTEPYSVEPGRFVKISVTDKKFSNPSLRPRRWGGVPV